MDCRYSPTVETEVGSDSDFDVEVTGYSPGRSEDSDGSVVMCDVETGDVDLDIRAEDVCSGSGSGSNVPVELPVCSSDLDQQEVIYNDLGTIIKPGMSCDEISNHILALSQGQKYKLLIDHFIPSKKYKFPKKFDHGCNRSFQLKWLDKYSWLVYSKELDGGFCKFCALFAKDRNRCGVLVNKPFQNWVKVNKVVGHKTKWPQHKV